MPEQKTISERAVAVLHQGHTPPEVGGIRKPLKPGGYADSSADIACALQNAGVPIVLPTTSPDPRRDLDWSFPDTNEGIQKAVLGGAGILWANTVLYAGHPIEQALSAGVALVGQPPRSVQGFDDKRHTNELLRAAGCPVAAALVIGAPEISLAEERLRERGWEMPVIVKPIRGRGSAGVQRVDRWEDLRSALDSLIPVYGTAVLVEEYLPGEEVTISVLPPGSYEFEDRERQVEQYWSLPPVLRFNHQDGIAPYSGVVAVTKNSRALGPREEDAALRTLRAHCERAAAVSARMVIRIDCRQDRSGDWRLFDLNMKPNMTGAGRPGRDDQDSLTALAARAMGWDYAALVLNLLNQAWTAYSASRLSTSDRKVDSDTAPT